MAIGKAILGAAVAAGISSLLATPAQKRKGRAVAKKAVGEASHMAGKMKRAATARVKAATKSSGTKRKSATSGAKKKTVRRAAKKPMRRMSRKTR